MKEPGHEEIPGHHENHQKGTISDALLNPLTKGVKPGIGYIQRVDNYYMVADIMKQEYKGALP
jgi:hypothetical protein